MHKDIGQYIKEADAFDPIASTGAAHNGKGIDRAGQGKGTLHLSLVMVLIAGSATGSPTAQTADMKLQDSADNSTFADVTGETVTQIIADDKISAKNVDLSALRRYVRVVVTTTLTAGTSPTLPVAAAVVLGPAEELPI